MCPGFSPAKGGNHTRDTFWIFLIQMSSRRKASTVPIATLSWFVRLTSSSSAFCHRTCRSSPTSSPVRYRRRRSSTASSRPRRFLVYGSCLGPAIYWGRHSRLIQRRTWQASTRGTTRSALSIPWPSRRWFDRHVRLTWTEKVDLSRNFVYNVIYVINTSMFHVCSTSDSELFTRNGAHYQCGSLCLCTSLESSAHKKT